MLQKIIKNIRAKPESVRKGITLGISLGITGIVSFFWFISFLNYSAEVLTAKPKVESPTTFLGKMSSLIGESYANVKSKIGSSNTAFVGESSTTTATTTEVDAFGIDTTSSATSTDSATLQTTQSASTESGSTTSTNDSKNSGASSKSLGDILNTKKQDNQGNKATTSSENLVQ